MQQKLDERIEFIQRSMNGRDPHGRYIDTLPRPKRASAPTPPPASGVTPPSPATPVPNDGEEPQTELRQARTKRRLQRLFKK